MQSRETPLKTVFVKGVLGRDFYDLTNVLKVAKTLGKKLYSTQEEVRVLKITEAPEYGGFIVLLAPPKCCKAPSLQGAKVKTRSAD